MNALKIIGVGIGVILAIYALWAVFIPMAIGNKIVEREIIQQSPQYVISQRDAILKLYTSYTKEEGATKQAIKTQICEIANNIPVGEVPTNAKSLCNL